MENLIQMQVEFLFEFSPAYGALWQEFALFKHDFYSTEETKTNVTFLTVPISTLNTLTTRIT